MKATFALYLSFLSLVPVIWCMEKDEKPKEPNLITLIFKTVIKGKKERQEYRCPPTAKGFFGFLNETQQLNIEAPKDTDIQSFKLLLHLAEKNRVLLEKDVRSYIGDIIKSYPPKKIVSTATALKADEQLVQLFLEEFSRIIIESSASSFVNGLEDDLCAMPKDSLAAIKCSLLAHARLSSRYFNPRMPLQNQEGWTKGSSSVAYLNKKSLIACNSSEQKFHYVSLYSLEGGAQLAKIMHGQTPIDSLAFHPEGEFLVVGSSPMITQWGLKAKAVKQYENPYPNHHVLIRGVSSDGKICLEHHDHDLVTFYVSIINTENGEISSMPISESVADKRALRDSTTSMVANKENQEKTAFHYDQVPSERLSAKQLYTLFIFLRNSCSSWFIKPWMKEELRSVPDCYVNLIPQLNRMR